MISLNLHLKDPRREKTTLFFDLYHFGQRLRYYPGFTVETAQWNPEKQRHKKNPNLNIALQKIEDKIRSTVEEARLTHELLTSAELKARVETIRVVHSFWTMYDEFIREKKPLLAERTITKHGTAVYKLKEFEKETGYRLSFQNINQAFVDRFMGWMYSKQHLNGYIDSIFNCLAAFLSWCVSKKVAVNPDYKDVFPSGLDEPGSPVFLFESELEGLCEFDFAGQLIRENDNVLLQKVVSSSETFIHALERLTKGVEMNAEGAQEAYTDLRRILSRAERLSRVRDRFVLACATGLRVSDLRKINPQLISEDAIIIPAITKTRVKDVRIPLNRFSRKVIDRVKQISDQKYNVYMKEMGEVAGLKRPVTRVQYSGTRAIEKSSPLYSFLTSHVARSTFITISMMKGISDDAIMAVTGIKKERTLRRYKKVVDQWVTQEMSKWG